jgi:hypothetical protein
LNIMSGGNNNNSNSSSNATAGLFSGAPPGPVYHGPCPTTTFQGQNSYQPGQSPVIGFPAHGPSPLFGGPQPAAASAVYPGGSAAAYSTFHPHVGGGAGGDPAGMSGTGVAGSFGSPFRGQLGGPYMEGRGGPKGGLQQYNEDQGIDMTLVSIGQC